jgi:secreted PhoX family phosphatase
MSLQKTAFLTLLILLSKNIVGNVAPSTSLNLKICFIENFSDTVVKKSATPRCTEIACFTSIIPTSQTDTFTIPASHSFQVLAQSGDAYQNGGVFPSNFDFTCYVPFNGSSSEGIITLNHENYVSGGMSIMNVQYDTSTHLWNTNNAGPVDFSGVVRTERSCSGCLTPWGTVVFGEEIKTLVDTNNDGYKDVGWLVEVNPFTRQVMEYGNAGQQKLWAMGRMKHENAAVSFEDSKTVYYGEDDSWGCVYKFVANTAGDLSEGELFVLKIDSILLFGEPTYNGGAWIPIGNSNQDERNNTHQYAYDLGATTFYGVEDVEIGPDGYIYFASKGYGRVYRFIDNGTTVAQFKTFVGGRNYLIQTQDSLFDEPWGYGNDNLAFDGEGNLWVLQDGSKNLIWVVKNGHTQENPLVEIFASTPRGAEPTGITFSPDKRFLFMSLQHPDSTNTLQLDASGNLISINKESLLVIARKEFLGNGTPLSLFEQVNNDFQICVSPNPFSEKLRITYSSKTRQSALLKVFTIGGKVVYEAQLEFSPEIKDVVVTRDSFKGVYWVWVIGPSVDYLKKIIAE